MATYVKRRRLDAYFEPVYPMETSETVKGNLIQSEDAIIWNTPLIPRTIVSNLKEKKINDNVFLTTIVPQRREKVAFFSEECKSRGSNAEKLFLDLAILKKKWIPKIIEEASKYDYLYHVDFMFKNPDNSLEEYWVDVKSLRATRRHWALQSEYMWVELNCGGWLFGGKATIVAQQINENSFVLLDREKLCEYVKQCKRICQSWLTQNKVLIECI
jgi:hypothetical protein